MFKIAEAPCVWGYCHIHNVPLEILNVGVPYHFACLHLFHVNSLLPMYASTTCCASYQASHIMYNCKECFVRNYFMCIPPDDDPTGIETCRSF